MPVLSLAYGLFFSLAKKVQFPPDSLLGKLSNAKFLRHTKEQYY
jgi:hypothetical protein